MRLPIHLTPVVAGVGLLVVVVLALLLIVLFVRSRVRARRRARETAQRRAEATTSAAWADTVEEPEQTTDPRDQWWVAPSDRDDDVQNLDSVEQDGAWEPDTEPVIVHREPIALPEPTDEAPSDPEPDQMPPDTGPADASTAAPNEVELQAQVRPQRQAGDEPSASSDAAKDRLLRVLLSDPETALVAVGDLADCLEQLDRLTESVGHQRGELAKVARRLRSAGLTTTQVAQLAGVGEGELAALLTEHAPSPRPRVR